MLKTDENIRSGFKFYKKKYEPAVDEKHYVKILNEFNQFIFDMVFEGYEVHLPAKMGVLSIIGKKKVIKFDEDGRPNLPPDWKKTKALWERNPEAKAEKKLVYITNAHSDGIIYRFFWSKLKMMVTYKSAYSFQATRENKRRIWSEVTAGKEFVIKY
tara:strand:+ start:1125 stop:1595 length:471 start_codon:yes stop_codon:yes gene_type:complete